MGHHRRFHIGWENEQLAHYLLSRFSFVAHPSTVGDDVGSDFYCTIYEVSQAAPDRIEPSISFAIQVKSNARKIAASNKIAYLEQLEIPFFISVVDKAKAALRMYSSECLPMLFADKHPPTETKRLSLRLLNEQHDRQSHENYVKRQEQGACVLNCHHVCRFCTSDTRDGIQPKVNAIKDICRRAILNIGSRRSEEHLYHWPNGEVTVLAGKGSIRHFRENLDKRLAESFANFGFLCKFSFPVSLDEFTICENLYLELRRLRNGPSLSWVDAFYQDAKEAVANRFPPTNRD
jgi:hypothetical protein